MPVTIATESPLQDDVRALVAELNEHLRPLSPPQFQFQMTVDEMAESATTVFVARDASRRTVGSAALTVHTADLGEVKRMYARPDVRGTGVGSRLLDAVIAHARANAVGWLMLETGVGPGFASAWALYERAGFARRGSFLNYPDSGWSAYFELCLDAVNVRGGR